MRSWFWWPTTWPQAGAGGIVVVLMIMLALFDIRFPLFKDYIAIQASPQEFFWYGAAISVANYVFLYFNSRGDYVRTATALPPITVTYIFFFILFPAVFAVGRYFLKGSPAPDFGALRTGALAFLGHQKLSDAELLQWTRAMRVFFVGEAGLSSLLLFSGLLKAPPADTLEFAGALGRARPLVHKVFRQPKEKVTSDEVKELMAYLKALTDGAGKIVGRELPKADRKFINDVLKAAKELHGKLESRPAGVIDGLRTSNDERIVKAVDTFEGA
jgi:hypothetical protein